MGVSVELHHQAALTSWKEPANRSNTSSSSSSYTCDRNITLIFSMINTDKQVNVIITKFDSGVYSLNKPVLYCVRCEEGFY